LETDNWEHEFTVIRNDNGAKAANFPIHLIFKITTLPHLKTYKYSRMSPDENTRGQIEQNDDERMFLYQWRYEGEILRGTRTRIPFIPEIPH
jgi:hypothetical protein